MSNSIEWQLFTHNSHLVTDFETMYDFWQKYLIVKRSMIEPERHLIAMLAICSLPSSFDCQKQQFIEFPLRFHHFKDDIKTIDRWMDLAGFEGRTGSRAKQRSNVQMFM